MEQRLQQLQIVAGEPAGLIVRSQTVAATLRSVWLGAPLALRALSCFSQGFAQYDCLRRVGRHSTQMVLVISPVSLLEPKCQAQKATEDPNDGDDSDNDD